MPSKYEVNMMKMVIIYLIRLIVKSSDKENYTKAELMDMLNDIAIAKAQEN